jgi:iron complex outermembrane receptor protein
MRYLSSSSSILSLLIAQVLLPPNVAQSQSQPTQAQPGTSLPQINVQAPRRRAATRQTRPASESVATPPATPPAQPPQTAASTPLNTNVVAPSASRLGLTLRETPAAVEVVGAKTMQEQGYQTIWDVAKGATGVQAGNNPNDAAFAMRGFMSGQLNVLYNGINLQASGYTLLPMQTNNLASVEFLKGPSSLMSGEGAVGGAINFVTKTPHTGAVQNEAFVGIDSLGSVREGFGSGGSTAVQGLDYRFDVSRSVEKGFIDDTDFKNLHISGQLDYRMSETFKAFIAAEHKDYQAHPYEGTPLVPIAFSGPFATSGIVSGTKISNYNGTDLGPVTIDSRTLTTNYNVLDNHQSLSETWVRGGFEWDIASNITLKTQAYHYDAHRDWFNSEVSAFNTSNNLVDRERFYVHHDQSLIGNNSSVTWDSRIYGMDNRLVTAVEYYHLDFIRPAAANFPHDFVTLVDPIRGFYGLLTTQQQTAVIDSVAVNLEDRLKITPTIALIGGLRYNPIRLDRTATDVNGVSNDGFPYSKSWQPVNGRIGYTWEPVRGMTFFSQYATASDLSAGDFFLLAE